MYLYIANATAAPHPGSIRPSVRVRPSRPFARRSAAAVGAGSVAGCPRAFARLPPPPPPPPLQWLIRGRGREGREGAPDRPD